MSRSRPEEASTRLPGDGASARDARRFVSATLRGWGRTDLDDVATLLVSELAANVVLHAGTDFVLHLRRTSGGVRVEVQDRSPRLPERKHYSATSATGRGLMLVEELTEAWGVEATTEGKSVWFTLDRASSPSPAANAGEERLRLEDWDDLMELPPLGPPRPPDAAGRSDGERPPHPPAEAGRAAVTDASAGEVVEVMLLSPPLALYRRASEHHDELRREFALINTSNPDVGTVPGRLQRLIDELDARFGAFTAQPAAAMRQALARGDERIDLTYRVPPQAKEASLELAALPHGHRAGGGERHRQTAPVAHEPVGLAPGPERRWAGPSLGSNSRRGAGHPPRRWPR